MDDISPELLDAVRETFHGLVGSNPRIKALSDKILSGAATYADADVYADLVGTALSKAFSLHLTADVLPNGKMYYNIAEKVIRPMLGEDYDLISDMALKVQAALNKQAGLGLSALRAPIDEDRILGILDKLADADDFQAVSWVLGDPVVNFSMHVVDATLQRNVEFQGRTGLRPRIVRVAEHKCCEWCSALDGIYDYGSLPDGIYQRHDNCRCTVEYDPGDGRRQDVHTKRWR